MFEKFQRMLTITAMAAILALGTSNTARADLEIQASTDGVTYTTLASAPSGGVATFTGTEGGDSITGVLTTSNSPGGPDLAFLSGAVLTLKNISTVTKTIYIKLGDTDFTSPTAPPTLKLLSHIGTTVVTGSSANALGFQSYVDPANGQNTTVGITTGLQTPNIVSGSANNDASMLITTLGASYSMTELFKVTLGAGSQINFASSTTLASSPEPSSLAIAGLSGLGLIGFGLRRRFKGA